MLRFKVVTDLKTNDQIPNTHRQGLRVHFQGCDFPTVAAMGVQRVA